MISAKNSFLIFDLNRPESYFPIKKHEKFGRLTTFSVEDLFSNSLIIHEEKTKEGGLIGDPNYHKIRCFEFLQELFFKCFEKLYQTLERVFHQISKVGGTSFFQPSVWICDETLFLVFDIIITSTIVLELIYYHHHHLIIHLIMIIIIITIYCYCITVDKKIPLPEGTVSLLGEFGVKRESFLQFSNRQKNPLPD